MVVLRPKKRALIIPTRSFVELRDLAEHMTDFQKKEMLAFLHGKHTERGLEVQKHNILPEATLRIGKKAEIHAEKNRFKIPGGTIVGEGMVHAHVDDIREHQVPPKLKKKWMEAGFGKRRTIPSIADTLMYKTTGGYILMLGSKHEAYYVQGTNVREVPLILKPTRKHG